MLNDVDDFMIDEEIHQSAAVEWLGILSKLWTSVGKTPTQDQLQVYQEMLGDVPLKLLEQTINRTLREHKYNTVPTIGNVWDAFIVELNPQPGMSVREALGRWESQLWDSVVYRFDEVTS